MFSYTSIKSSIKKSKTSNTSTLSIIAILPNLE